jgi:hypothetical protein
MLVIIGVVALDHRRGGAVRMVLVGSVCPALYRSAGGGPGVENARLAVVTTTRAVLLAGLVGLGALGTLWLNSRVYRIRARTFLDG